MIKDLNPVFFELLIDSVKDCNKNLGLKNKRSLKLNKTITLFLIYLNIFSTKKINIQENKKQIYVDINSVDLTKEHQILFFKVLNKELEPRSPVFFADLYSSTDYRVSTFQKTKSAKILENLNMI